jgi:hypothetical protein
MGIIMLPSPLWFITDNATAGSPLVGAQERIFIGALLNRAETMAVSCSDCIPELDSSNPQSRIRLPTHTFYGSENYSFRRVSAVAKIPYWTDGRRMLIGIRRCRTPERLPTAYTIPQGLPL